MLLLRLNDVNDDEDGADDVERDDDVNVERSSSPDDSVDRDVTQCDVDHSVTRPAVGCDVDCTSDYG